MLGDRPAELSDAVGLFDGFAAVFLHDAVIGQPDFALALEGGKQALLFRRIGVEDLQRLVGHMGEFLIFGAARAGVGAVEDVGVLIGVDLNDALPLQRFKDLFSVGV